MWFISSVLRVFVMNLSSKILLTKNSLMYKNCITPNGPSVCIICEENDAINNGLIKKITYVNNKHLVKISSSIGESH